MTDQADSWRKEIYMFYLLRRNFLPFLDGEGGGAGGTGGTGGTGSSGGTGDGGKPEKTFTQEDLNRIAAQEKRQGAASILKALGFESEEKAKEYLDAKRKEDEEKKGDLEKAKDAEELAKKAKAEAEAKADLLEKRFKVVALGVAADKADDIVTLANAKVTESKTFDDAIEDLKKTYPELFAQTEKKGGTGSSGNPPRGKGGKESSIGKRLAEQRKTKSQTQKKGYFSTN